MCLPFCVKCGRKIPDGAAFCPNCGTPVTPKVVAPVKPKIVSKKPSMRVRHKETLEKYRRAPRHAIAIFLLGSIIVFAGLMAILLHELAGWFTLGMALLIMFASIAIGFILWFIARKLGMSI